MSKGQSIRDRFWSKVDIDVNGCWLWMAGKMSNGYGGFKLGKKMMCSHRISWWLSYNEWPKQKVLHHCDNKLCVRPSHLFLGTSKDNTQDMIAKKRHSYGEDSPHSKLTEYKVKEIISKLTGERGELQRLAKEYKVTEGAIRSIKNKRTWKHLIFSSHE